MIWAIVGKSGAYAIRYDDPSDTESKTALRGKAVWQLDREPAVGETVCFETGKIVFDSSRIAASMVADIKAEAERRILEVAPIWRQINDMLDPTEKGAANRRKKIDAIRQWSNETEAKVKAATSIDEIASIRAELTCIK